MRGASSFQAQAWPDANSGVKEEAIFKEIELCVHNRNSLEKALLVLSSTPLIAIFSMMLGQKAYEAQDSSLTMQIIFLAAPILYLFILYNTVKYTTKMVRLNSYLGYLEDILSAHYDMRDVLMWHREINIEERYSFIGSLFQVPFHVVALILLGFASAQAHPFVYANALAIGVVADLLMLLLAIGIVLMLIAATMAHWDTKATINVDRVRNRLSAMPPYYTIFGLTFEFTDRKKPCFPR